MRYRSQSQNLAHKHSERYKASRHTQHPVPWFVYSRQYKIIPQSKFSGWSKIIYSKIFSSHNEKDAWSQ